MKELQDLYRLPGLITDAEVDCLYWLGQSNDCACAIVEIGSGKGKSTVESQVEPVKPKTAVIRPAKSNAFDTDDTSH